MNRPELAKCPQCGNEHLIAVFETHGGASQPLNSDGSLVPSRDDWTDEYIMIGIDCDAIGCSFTMDGPEAEEYMKSLKKQSAAQARGNNATI